MSHARNARRKLARDLARETAKPPSDPAARFRLALERATTEYAKSGGTIPEAMRTLLRAAGTCAVMGGVERMAFVEEAADALDQERRAIVEAGRSAGVS